MKAARSSPVTMGLLGKAAEGVTLVGIAVLLPRVLGPADYGQFAIALSFVTIGATATAVGGPALMARFLPALPAAERAGAARSLVARLAPVRIGWAIAACAAATALALGERALLSGVDLALASLALALSATATLFLQAGLGLGRVGAWTARYPLENAVIVVVALAMHGALGAAGAIAALPVAAAASLALALPGALILRAAAPVTAPAGALRFARLQAASGGLTQLHMRGAIPLVAIAAGAAEAGATAIAIGVALALAFAVLQLFVVSLPDAVARAQGDLRAAEAELRALAIPVAVAVVPGCVALALASGWLTPFLFGDSYGDAAGPLAVALAIPALAPASGYLTQVAVLRMRPGSTAIAALAGTLAFAVAATFLIGPHGALGGCIAAATGSAVAVTAQAILLARPHVRTGTVTGPEPSRAAIAASE